MAATALTGLVGREVELGRLETFLSDATHGPEAIVLVGEAGIGKTTVWRAAVERARTRGFRVLEARPTEAERNLSFAGLGDLLADAHDQIGGLPAPQRRALRVALLLEEPRGTPPDERAVATALASLLASLAEDHPVVVAIDDVQWLDRPTHLALQFALRRTRVPALFARRTSEDGAELQDAAAVDLPPLGLEELNDLLRRHLSASFLRPTLLEIQRVSGGNPLFALELARALVTLPRPPGPLEPLPVPDDLHGLFAARLDRLTPRGRSAALLAAAALRPSFSLLERIGADAVDELMTAGVLVHDGNAIRFAHPLLAATAYSRSTADERAAAHRRLAASTADIEERGHHLAAAADAPDADVAAAVEAASAQARARGAPDTAGQLATRAVELTPSDDADALHRRRLMEADIWIAAGDLDQARSVLEAALLSSTGRQRGEVLCTLAYMATNIDCEYERALEIAGAGLVALAPEDADLRAQLELARCSALNRLERDDEWEAAGRAAVEAAEAAGDVALLSRVLSGQFFYAFARGLGDDVPLILRAIELSEQEPPSEQQPYTGHLWAQHHYANYLSMTHQTNPAREILVRLRDRARALGDADEAYYLGLLGWNEYECCRYDDALRYAEESLQLSRLTGRTNSSLDALYLIVFIHVCRGDLDEACEAADELGSCGEALDPMLVRVPDARVHGLLSFLRGDFAEAVESFVASGSSSETKDPTMRAVLPSHAEALIALGRLEEATALLDPYEDGARTFDRPVELARALRCRALLRAAERDYPSAQAAFDDALALHDRLEVPYERARTLLAYGALLRRRRQRERARQLLAASWAVFDELGCSGWAARAQEELSQLGGRRAQTGSLTSTEQRVAALVARGRSNAEVANELFISPKTVEWNLSKVYRKLHVRSRAELAAKLLRDAQA